MGRNRIEFSVEARDRASAALRGVSREVDVLGSAFRRLGVAAVAALSVREIAQYADSWRLTQNRIRLVTQSTAELNAVTKELVDLSLRSRTEFVATANLYARVARSSRELGLSQKDLLEFTETVSKSIRVSGSTAAEASAGVIQFGQALASSRLSGDELRSVLEQMPRLAQAIAQGMGVSIGTLRELGEQGKLSTDVVLGALRTAGPEIAEEFSSLTPLVSEAFGNLETSLVASIGLFDEFFGVSNTVANGLIDLADQVLLFSRALTGSLETKTISDEMKSFGDAVSDAIQSGEGLDDVLNSNTAGSVRLAKSLGITITELRALGQEGGAEKLAGLFNKGQKSVGKFDEAIIQVADSIGEIASADIDIATDFDQAAVRASTLASNLGLTQEALRALVDIAPGASLKEAINNDSESAKALAANLGTTNEQLQQLVSTGEGFSDIVNRNAVGANRLAESLGISIDEFIALGETGQITADQLRDLGAAGALTASDMALLTQESDNASGSIDITASAIANALSPADDLSEALQRMSIFAITVAGTFGILATSLKTTLGFGFKVVGEAAGAFAAQLVALAELDFSRAASIGTDFKEQLLDGFGEDTFEELQEKLILQVTDMMEKIGVVLGEIEVPELNVDLTTSTDSTAGLTRNQREEIARLATQREKMLLGLEQQREAFLKAEKTGVDVALALKQIRIETLALDPVFGNSADGAKFLSEALGALADVTSQEEQADNRAVIEGLQERLRLEGFSNKQKFIQLELSKLSANALAEEKSAVKETAEALFNLQEAIANQMKFMENLAERAAQGIFDAFSDFLFDPFDEGLKGMLASFINVLRKMIADLLAFQLLSGIPVIGEILSKRAAGGPITAGQPVLVGERGPEIIVPGGNGTVIPNHALAGAGGGLSFVSNIDARGADPGLIARLPTALDQRDKRIMLAVKRYVETGVMPI